MFGWYLTPAGAEAGTCEELLQSAWFAPEEVEPSPTSSDFVVSRSKAETAPREIAPMVFLASEVLALARYRRTP